MSLVVLVTIAEALTATELRRSSFAVTMFLDFALAAPVLFAVGSAGMSFAMEREEGTLEFLRGMAVSPMQLWASKLFVTILATAALYVVLWPISFYFSRGLDESHIALRETISLWSATALEAIAWGTFFSLRGTRPLLAICEAIFVTVFTAFLLVGFVGRLSLTPAADAVPWRILVAAIVLAIDVYLADFWPDRESGESWLRTIPRQGEADRLASNPRMFRPLRLQCESDKQFNSRPRRLPLGFSAETAAWRWGDCFGNSGGNRPA